MKSEEIARILEDFKNDFKRDMENLKEDLKKDFKRDMEDFKNNFGAKFERLERGQDELRVGQDNLTAKLERLSMKSDHSESKINGILQGLEFVNSVRGREPFNPFTGASYSLTSVSHPPLVPRSRSRFLRER